MGGEGKRNVCGAGHLLDMKLKKCNYEGEDIFTRSCACETLDGKGKCVWFITRKLCTSLGKNAKMVKERMKKCMSIYRKPA